MPRVDDIGLGKIIMAAIVPTAARKTTARVVAKPRVIGVAGVLGSRTGQSPRRRPLASGFVSVRSNRPTRRPPANRISPPKAVPPSAAIQATVAIPAGVPECGSRLRSAGAMKDRTRPSPAMDATSPARTSPATQTSWASAYCGRSGTAGDHTGCRRRASMMRMMIDATGRALTATTKSGNSGTSTRSVRPRATSSSQVATVTIGALNHHRYDEGRVGDCSRTQVSQ